MNNLTFTFWLALIFLCKAQALKIKSFSFPNNTVAGDTVSVTCMLSSLTAQTTFKWLKDGTDLSLLSQKETRIQILSTNSASVLFVHSIIPEDFGNYTCIASTPYGYDKFTASLIVNVPPKWILEPKNLSIKEGDVAIIDCLASGNPMPIVSWLISKSTQDDLEKFTLLSLNYLLKGFTVLQNSSLYIESSKFNFKEKTIFVQCLADNQIKKPLRKIIKISLIVPARFTNNENFKIQNIKKGESASLRCQAIGDQPLQMQWFKDKQVLDFKSSRYDHFETKTDRGIISELLIRTTERFDGALYTCNVKNNYGSDEKNIKLIIMEVPEAPIDVKMINYDSRSATVAWSPPYNGNNPIESYFIHFWKNDKTLGKNNKLNVVKVDSSKTMFNLKGLKPGASYILNVIASNKIGYGEPSRSFYFTTNDEKPNTPPIDVHIYPKGASHVLIFWKSPPRDQMNGNVTGYTIKYHALGESQEYTRSVVADYSLNYLKEYRYNLTGLKKSTFYKISIAGNNLAGQGPYSQEILVKTLEGEVPKAPKITSHVILSESSLLINWQPLNDQILFYTIYIRQKKDFFYENIILVEKQYYSNTIHGLTNNQEYLIFVSATNRYGESDFSQPLVINIQSNSLSFSSLLAKNNVFLFFVLFIAIICILIALIISAVYLKRLKRKQKETIRQMSNLSIKSSKYFDKCGTTLSTATYATIDPIENHVTIKSNSNSHSSSNGYGSVIPNADEVRFIQISNRSSKPISKQSTSLIKKKLYNVDIFDDSVID